MSLCIKKAFDITRDNIVVAQPIVIFMIVISLTTGALYQQTNKIAYMVFFVANILLCTAFFSGWFNMIQKTLEHNKKAEKNFYRDDREKAEASFALGKEFFPGVGEYFLPVTFTLVAYVVVYMLLLVAAYKFGMKYLPHPHINWSEFMAAANSTPAQMQKYVASLSFYQLKAMNIWMFFFGAVFCVFSLLTMFLFPALYNNLSKRDDKKNPYLKSLVLAPFSAFNTNIVFVFRHFLGSVSLLIFLLFLNIIMSVLSLVFSLNIVLTVFGLLLSFYVMTYALVLIFLYYDENK